MRVILIAALSIISSIFSPVFAADPSEVVFGIGPNENLLSDKELSPLINELSQTIGHPIRLAVANTHAAQIEAMRANQIQVAWFSTRAAVEVIANGHGEIFAEIDGSNGDKTSIIVRKDSPIAAESDEILTGKRISKYPKWLAGLQPLFDHAGDVRFLDCEPVSTAGFIADQFFFAENGFHPAMACKSYATGELEDNALAVADGRADAAVFKASAMEIVARRHPEQAARIRVVCRGPGGGNDPLVWRDDLQAGVKDKIRDFFLSYAKSESNRSKLAVIKWKGFLPASNAHVNPFRYMLLLDEKARIEKDSALSPQERQSKLAAIEPEIARLKALRGWHIPHRKPIDYTRPIEPQLEG